jgi:hypothetical protein
MKISGVFGRKLNNPEHSSNILIELLLHNRFSTVFCLVFTPFVILAMENNLQFEGYTIEKVFMPLQVNFVVTNKEGYVCQLVPHELGFGLSPKDKSLGNEPDPTVIKRISDFLESTYE